KLKDHQSLLPFLQSNHCVPDELHLMLCIVNVLLEELFYELMNYPNFDFKSKSKSKLLQPQSLNISICDQIENTMESIGVNFRFYNSETAGGKYKLTALMGPAKKHLLEKFPVTNYLPESRGQAIEKLW
ncbi:43899_t:CDS:1, partial [Gigaspora margarita]